VRMLPQVAEIIFWAAEISVAIPPLEPDILLVNFSVVSRLSFH